MKINKNTKISTILKENEEAIDAIASISPHFNKLRNPILRKLLASRVTIEDAAKIGKCTIQDFFNKLEKIGFDIEESNNETVKTKKTMTKNIEEAIKQANVIPFDVRSILAGGVDPFQAIMGKLKETPDGTVLELVNSFEPVPLINILSKKGYETFVERKNNAVYTYFLKTPEITESTNQETTNYLVNLEDFNQQKKTYEGNLHEIDVRDMEMPLPMVTILSELEKLSCGSALFVHHKKIPQFLLGELQNRHYSLCMTEIDENNVKLLIHR